jgi:hypothetical protein
MNCKAPGIAGRFFYGFFKGMGNDTQGVCAFAGVVPIFFFFLARGVAASLHEKNGTDGKTCEQSE